ncbi:MAG: PQQ-binding-like beta-propeller repeat protein [Isosphaeraceae bacterium]
MGLLILGAGPSVAATAIAQAPRRQTPSIYPETNNTADQLLRAAASHTQSRQWSEAVDLYQRVIQQFGNAMASMPTPSDAKSVDSRLYIDARSFSQRQLAAMPAEALALYRGRVDAQAERWYREGTAARDRALLRRVVDEAFCSSWGDDALEVLGDWAFQDGRLAEALESYRRLLPDGEGLAHPDPDLDRPRLIVKTWIVRAAFGGPAPTDEEVAAFRAQFPDAQGSLAGRTGPLADVALKAIAEDGLRVPEPLEIRWPTFAGSSGRNRLLTEEIDVGSPQWSIRIDRIASGRGFTQFAMRPGTVAPPAAEAIAAYHPIVLGEQVIIAGEQMIRAYNLSERPKSAEDVLWQYPPQGPRNSMPTARTSSKSARYSLTAAGDRVFARLGASGSSPGQSNSEIVALDLAKQGAFLWKVKAGEIEIPNRAREALNRSNVGFEGAPVADGRSIYVALSEAGPQISTWVACLNAETGKPRWIRFVCSAPPGGPDNGGGFGGGMINMAPIAPPADAGQRMLTLDGNAIYYQTSLGGLACLDAETGRLRWLATYPRIERNNLASFDRDLAPAIAAEGRVFFCPNDSAIVCAFDAATGRLLWKREDLPRIDHLLGVARGRLVATGDHAWTLDASTGKVLSTWPDNLAGFEGFGRGLLAGEHILWPTRTEIQVLDLATGFRATHQPPIQLARKFQQGGGNLVAGDGYLVVAGGDSLSVYSQNSRLIQRYMQEIARDPGRAGPYFSLAQIAEATGDEALALRNFDGALAHARPSDLVDGRPLAEAARNRRHSLLMRLGDRAARSGDWATARDRFLDAVEGSPPGKERLSANFKLSEAQRALARPSDAVATLQKLLGDDTIRTLTVPLDDRQTVRADLRIADMLDSILKESGREPYAPYDAQARALLRKAAESGDPRALEEIGRTYPAADCLPEAWLRLGRLRMGRDQLDEAARAYRRLLAESGASDAERATALLELGRCHERRKLWASARDVYSQAALFDGVSVPAVGLGRTAGDVARESLANPSIDRLGPAQGELSPPLPLARRWAKALEGPHRLLTAAGDPPNGEIGRIFLVRGQQLRPVNPITGELPWAAELVSDPAWIGYVGDRLVVAGSRGLTALEVNRGTPCWSYGPTREAGDPAGPDPFAGEGAGARNPADEPTLSGFRVIGDRLLCRVGERQLVAIEGESGLVAWSFATPGGAISPHLVAGPNRIVAQLRAPNSVVVLDAADGRCLGEFDQPDAAPAWPRAPMALDEDRILVAVDNQTVAAFDIRRGVESWRWVDDNPLPRSAQPMLLGDAQNLLVLFDGKELIRLESRSGGKIWSRRLGSEDISDRPEALAIDGRRVYFANDLGLGALDLKDGSPAWTCWLGEPNTGWSLILARHSLVAYPRRPGDRPEAMLPVAFHSRDDGSALQRFVIASPVRQLAVGLNPQGALIATQDGLWSLGEFRSGSVQGAAKR